MLNSTNAAKRNLFLYFSAFSFLFIGIKFALVHFYGNATPFWDQWDAEAANLYKSWNDGTLNLKQLVEHHNEHRIFTTRLLALVLISINKIWNPLLQMTVNAMLHLMAVLLFNSLLTKVLGRSVLPGLLTFSLVLFAIPFGWENTLAGFQGQFYFVLLFSIGAIWLLITSEPLSSNWWAGVALSILAFLSLASGVFVFATGAAVGLIMYLFKLRKIRKQLIATVLLAAFFLVGLKLTPTLEYHAFLKAHSFAEFYASLKVVFGWPVGWNLLSVFIRNLPIGIFVILMLKNHPAETDRRWFLFALCIWSFVQAVSIAYGKAAGSISSRYLDLHVIPIFVNFACLISLIQTSTVKWQRYAIVGFGLWGTIVLSALALYGFNHIPDELSAKHASSLKEEKNTRNYIATGNINFLRNKQPLDIPYPNADGLAQIIDTPGIRKILPFNIRKPLTPVSIESKPEGAFAINSYDTTTTGSPDTAWSSYNEHHDTAMGSTLMRFKANFNDVKIEIPVTGYHMDAGIKLELIQNNKVTYLNIPRNPGKSWDATYAWINKKDFSIRVTDSSTTSWIAIGQPLEYGKLDGITTRLLSHYYYFLIIGGIIVFLLITLTVISRIKTKSKVIDTSS